MISTPVLLLTTCVLVAAAVAQPYGAWNFPNSFQPGFPNNFGHNGYQNWFPLPQNTGPWVTTEDGVYQIVAKAENYNIDDIRVRIKDDSVLLRGDKMGRSSSSFSFSYTIPENGNVNEATAILTSNGYLIVRIPLTGNVGDVERIVPVTKSDEQYKKSD